MENGNLNEVTDEQGLINGDAGVPVDDEQLLLNDNSVKSLSAGRPSGCGGPAKNRLITVEPPMTLLVITYATILSLRAQYIRQRIAEDYGIYGPPGSYQMSCNDTSNNSVDSKIQSRTSEWGIFLSTAESIPMLFTVAILGAWSDRIGRKAVMLIPVVGLVLSSLVCLIIILCDLHLSVFFVSALIQGLSGGFPLLLALCFSYIADITTKEKRMYRLVVVEMIFFLGAGLSQVGMGYFLQAAGYAAPMLLAEILCVMAFFYIITPSLLPETVQRGLNNNPKPTREKRGQVLKNVIAMFRNNTNMRRRKLVVLFGAIFICAMITVASMTIESLYAQGLPFCWGSVLLGYFSAIDLACVGCGAIIGSKLLQMCLSDIYIVYVSLFDSIIALAVVATANTTTALLVSAPVGFLRGLSIPVLKSMVSKMVEKHEQGALFASLGSLQAIGSFVSPIFLNNIYAGTVKFFPPLVFYVMIGLYLIPVFLVCLLHIFVKIEASKEPSSVTTSVNGEEIVASIN